MPEVDIYIAITLDRKYIQHAAAMLSSVICNNPDDKIHVFVICDDAVTVADWQKLSTVFAHTNLSAEKVEIDTSLFKDFKLSDHASYANYFRIQMTELVPKTIDKILYLDVDIIVTGSIRPLYDTDVSGYYMGAVEDPDNFEKVLVGHKEDEAYFNSGIMVINLAMWRQTALNKRLADFILNNAAIIKYWDQDALNVVCKDQWKPLLPKYNLQKALLYFNKDAITYTLTDIKDAVAHPVIIHFTGKSKPWDYMDDHPMKKEYYKYLAKTPWRGYKPADKTIVNILRKNKLMPEFAEKIIQRK